MSSIAYIIPTDPQSPASKAVPGVDVAKLWSVLPAVEKPPKVGTPSLFFGTPGQDVTALISLGDGFANKKGNERRELIRRAVGGGMKDVKRLGGGVSQAVIDDSLDPHATAVAAHLALYKFTLKTTPPSPFDPRLKDPLDEVLKIRPVNDSGAWDRGVIYAKAQNLARTLMELPGNYMTPTIFTERVKKEFLGVPNVEITVHDEEWAAEMGMRTFLSVSKGTNEPAKFLEVHYTGAANKNAQPIVFVGKGITFDTGGISLKPGHGMKLMRGDMGGAAAVVSSLLAIAQLKLPVNIIALAPLTENMPGPSASKPGDIVYAMNGKSVEIDNTDAEGRLILSDALYYGSSHFKPHTLIDVATLTGAMDVALGEAFSGVFSTSDSLWEELNAAGEFEYDRFWRMPFDEEYGPLIYNSNADLCNYGGKPAGACTAALFLKGFVEGIETTDGKEPPVRWAHIDIAGTMEATRPYPYMEECGMTGRSVRALIEFVRRHVQA